MKIIKLLIILLLVVFQFPVYSLETINSGSIEVVIKNINNSDGKINIALVKDENALKDDSEQPFMGAIVAISNKSAVYVFKKVPFGEYAIKAFHDSNNNGVLDKGVFGIPKEQYGFSNTPASKKGIPKFKDAKFMFNEKTITKEIELK